MIFKLSYKYHSDPAVAGEDLDQFSSDSSRGK